MDIKDATQAGSAAPDTSAHQPYTLLVTIVNSPLLAMDTTADSSSVKEKAYNISYYQSENNAVVNHQATYGSKEDFTKAAYRWLDDTTVSVRLYNEKNNKSDSLKVFGNGSRNGMDTGK